MVDAYVEYWTFQMGIHVDIAVELNFDQLSELRHTGRVYIRGLSHSLRWLFVTREEARLAHALLIASRESWASWS